MHFFPCAPLQVNTSLFIKPHQALEGEGSLKLIKSDPPTSGFASHPALHPIRQDAVAVSGEHYLFFRAKLSELFGKYFRY